MRAFLLEFHGAIEDFEDVIDELLIFIYVSAPRKMKHSTLLKKKYQKQVQSNDEYRRDLLAELREELGDSLKALDVDENRFQTSSEALNKKKVSLRDVEGGPQNVMDELEYLNEFQVAFNFRRVEGITLFKHIRRWLNTDILNERLEVEHFINITIQFICLGLVALLVAYTQAHAVTVIWILVPYDIVVLFAFVLRALGLCISANEYLFDETEILLLNWQEHTTNWKEPESLFEFPDNDERKGIAWIWDGTKPKAVRCGFALQNAEEAHAKEIYRALDVLLRRCRLLEVRQRIMGLEVTKHLRNRMIASLGSVLVAIIVKAPDLLKNEEVAHALKQQFHQE
jgi:hypothetical protein